MSGMPKAIVLLAAGFACFLPGSPSQAAISYLGSVITNACGTRTETSGLGLNQSVTGSVAPGLACSSSAQNGAAPGQLRIGATGSVNGGANYGESTTDATANFSVDDLIITGGATTASGVLLLNVDGILGLSESVSGPNAISVADWLLRIDSTFGQGQTSRLERVHTDANGDVTVDSPTQGSSGVLAGYQGGTAIVELPFSNLPTNTNLSFFLTLSGKTRAIASNCTAATCAASNALNFMNTVSLVQGQAAFVFDDPGFLANSTSLNLQNNVWQPVVPLPGAAWLFGSALIAVVGAGRRKFP